MSGVFLGQKMLMLDNDQVFDFNKDKSFGIYDIHVKLYFKIRFKLGNSISRTYKPKVKCDLKVPLRSSNNATFTFTRILATKCNVLF
jgi:hypothetical protein